MDCDFIPRKIAPLAQDKKGYSVSVIWATPSAPLQTSASRDRVMQDCVSLRYLPTEGGRLRTSRYREIPYYPCRGDGSDKLKILS